ncbi:transposase, partial [Plantactinospora endophytica]
VCSTNAIESVNARLRRAVRARGHFPNEAAALKCVHLAMMSLDPTGQGRHRFAIPTPHGCASACRTSTLGQSASAPVEGGDARAEGRP